MAELHNFRHAAEMADLDPHKQDQPNLCNNKSIETLQNGSGPCQAQVHHLGSECGLLLLNPQGD